MMSFLAGIMVIAVFCVAGLSGLITLGVLVLFGFALIFLLKFFIVLFALVFCIWLIGKCTLMLFGKNKAITQ